MFALPLSKARLIDAFSPEWAVQHLNSNADYCEALRCHHAVNRALASSVIPIPEFAAGSLEKQTRLISEGKLFVDKRIDPIRLDRVDWVSNNHNFVSTQLHGLVGLGPLLRSKKKLPRNIEDVVAGHILDWARAAGDTGPKNPRMWNEGTVVKRQSNLLSMLNYIRMHGHFRKLDIRSLLFLIDGGANFLLDTALVYRRGNHGIRQDMLLAATALSLPDHPRAKEMIEIAERRLNKAAQELFTEEGIWREHAPGYVHYALRLMADIMDLHEAADGFNPALFIKHYKASRRYLLTSLTPAGRIPTIGQAAADRVNKRIATAGAVESHLQRKAGTLSAFPGYGHAVLRGTQPNGLYLLFVASQNLPAGKRDSADLSFILFNYARPWITEGGHVTYEESDIRDFTLSPLAHNTYILNGRYLSFGDRPDLLTRLTVADECATGFRIAGYTERFVQSARFERIMDVAKEFDGVSIRDSLQAQNVEAWEGRFQIPGDLEVLVEGYGVSVTDPATGNQMLLEFRSETALSFSTCKGQREPLCGWGQNPDGFGPVTTLTYCSKENTQIEVGVSFRETRFAAS